MKIIVTSPERARGFLGQSNVISLKREQPEQIRFGLSILQGMECSSIVVTNDVKNRFDEIINGEGTGTILKLDRPVEIFQEDDLPEVAECDHIIVIHDDFSITTANFKLKS